MNCTLIYQGELKSKGKPVHKHKIRQEFHRQLKQLWNQKPLSQYKDLIEKNDDKAKFSLVNEIGEYCFVPRVSGRMSSIAELDILVLQNGQQGAILSNYGDIDNRLKTLLDSLKIPKEPNDLPPDSKPEKDENPFYCLLEDDNLITKLNVRTEQFLGTDPKSKEVIVIIHVTTKLTRIGIGNLGFA